MYDDLGSNTIIDSNVYYKQTKKEIICMSIYHRNFLNYVNNKFDKSLLSVKNIHKEIINLTKDELIKSGKFAIYRGIVYANYSKYISEIEHTEFNRMYEKFLSADLNLSEFEEKCCRQIYDSQRKRVQRLRKKLRYQIENYKCLWLTLTFNNDILDSTSELTRRRYISRFCKSLKVPFYVANIDYGDKEKNPDSLEREHYHAIIQAEHIDMSLYEYGFIYVKQIYNSEISLKKITHYINKLTNHAFKDSTKGRARLIYSRKLKL